MSDIVSIIFTKPIKRKIGADLIACSERRPYSHAAIVFNWNGEKMIFQSSHGMVNVLSLKKFMTINNIVKSYDYNIDEQTNIKLIRFIQENLGSPYGFFQLIVIGIMKLIQIKSLTKQLYLKVKDGHDEFICSELALAVADIIDPRIDISNIQPDFFTPSDLDHLLENLHGKA